MTKQSSRRTAVVVAQATLMLSLLFPPVSCISTDQAHMYMYHRKLGFLCIRPQFVRHHPSVASSIACAALCSREQHCRAFTTADGPCQLFVFHKCSKSVRDCSCSRTGQVFVKHQPGLEPGALCPPGYGADLCGMKYKRFNGIGVWEVSRQKCHSELGLVIMADVDDASELSHIVHLSQANGATFWLGGYQSPGSSEPTGGWYWASCGGALDDRLWASGEPSNSLNRENAVEMYFGHTELIDAYENAGSGNVLCECLSPFD